MLCDLVLGEWKPTIKTLEDGLRAADIDDVVRRIDANGPELTPEERREIMEKHGESFAELLKWCERFREWENLDLPVHMSTESFPIERMAELRPLLRNAQKFHLTDAFAGASLDKLATPQTMLACTEWFRLTHDPMWMEWAAGGLQFGALFCLREGVEGVSAYIVMGRDGTRGDYAFGHCRLLPETARIEGGKFRMDAMDDNGKPFGAGEPWGGIATWAYDFIVRINSPRITEIEPPKDMGKLNRKREKSGKPPLCSYQVVDLNREVKHSLCQAGESGDGVRFHWRRGHFKARKSGLFWWRPHTAGRRELGEVMKEYVA